MKPTPINVDTNSRPQDYEFLKDDELLITDIFATVQGEGPFAGRRAVFVRLAGCNYGGKGVTGPGCPWCFTEATRIRMSDGSVKPIALVEEGERVVSYDEQAKTFEDKRVTQVMSRDVDTLLKIRHGKNRKLYSAASHTTDDHPFLTANRSWVRAADLREGDTLLRFRWPDRTRTETVKEITRVDNDSIGFRQIAEGFSDARVLNLGVEDTSTYIANGNIVHNCDTQFFFGQGERKRFDDIESTIRTERQKHMGNHQGDPKPLIVITGGEPMLQNNLPAFCRYLIKHGYHVQIETNGTRLLDIPPTSCHLVVSPKIPEWNGKVKNYPLLNDRVFERADCLKFIVSDDPESPYHDVPTYAFRYKARGKPVYVSPMAVYKQAPDEVNSIWDANQIDQEQTAKNHKRAFQLAMQYDFIVSVQMQLYMEAL